ncbi:MAG: multi-sensor hybrid histidine kinase [Pedosphaera sp.]|nr:multi-sensor hybrid histidine kinase [Pedosphaera sp.]
MRDQTRFETVVRKYQSSIIERIPHYVDEMLGVRGLFAANASVSVEQWQKYIASMEIERVYPGLKTLGYVEEVRSEQKEEFLRHIRANQGTNYQILPEGERAVYFPTVYASRLDGGRQGGTGHDHFTYTNRQELMEKARDTGQATATGKIKLSRQDANDASQAGFTIYLPVYRADAPIGNVEERRAALQGFIFASFEAKAMLAGIFGQRTNSIVALEVYDGGETKSENLLFADKQASQNYNPRLSETRKMPVLNRTWTLNFSSLPTFEAASQARQPRLVIVCGIAMSLLLFGITWAQVSARERAEKISIELRGSEAALAAEKERLAVTLYSICDGVITTDTAEVVISINKAAEQLTGWTQAEALGKPLTELFNAVQEKTRERCTSPVASVLKTGAMPGPTPAMILIARDGQERVIVGSAATIRNKADGTVGAVLVFRDITEKQKSEAELLKESKLESVGLLAGGIAHDFNNILMGIIGNISLARMNAHSSELMLERLAGVEKAALRAKELTQQLVMFARGGAPIRKQVQLPGMVKDATLFALHGASVHAEFSLAALTWGVEVDEGQFRQVIHNIVLNAVQAMPEGGKIEVRAENVEFTNGFLPPLVAGKYVKISIRDHGTGIAPEHLPKIFDPYFSTRKHARGLGLASAHSVMRKHEGQISVESQVGQGSTFQVYLPASFKAELQRTPDTNQRRLFGHGRILVMDDEADILTLVQDMLKMMGYEVETARDGVETLAKYQAAKQNAQAFAVVIMDLTVPEGMGGKEAIRRLREMDPQVKAIVSSGYSYDPVMASFQEYGFSGVIPKPYVMEDLGRVVGEVVSQKRDKSRKPEIVGEN